jgi:antimicrobial peptide system SdpA family protein
MKVLVLLFMTPICMCLVFMTSMSYFAFNPLSIDYEQQVQIRTLIPQGWAFFTRSSREKVLLFYKKEADNWVLVNSSSATYTKLFGLSRLSRRQNIEFGSLAAQLNGVKNWKNCENNLPNTCISDSTNVLLTKYKNAVIKGEYLARLTEPVPWAWRSMMNEDQRKSQVLKILVVNDTTKIR